MARKVVVALIDDFDGGEATQTVTFGLRGVNYEIDLSDENASFLDKALAPFVGHARKSDKSKRAAGRTGATPDGVDPKAVRVWAAERGLELGVRGRIPFEIVERYLRTPRRG